MSLTRSFFALCLVTATLCSECRSLLSSEGLTTFLAEGNLTVVSAFGQPCSELCDYPLHFQTPNPSQKSSFACQALTGNETVFGYQLGASNTCSIASHGEAVDAADYQCLCLDAGQTQGLDLPGLSNTCSDSCSSSIDGMAGVPVTSGSAYACLGRSEIGNANRFGQSAGATCVYSVGSTIQTTDEFSCACVFGIPGSPEVLPLKTAATTQLTQNQLSSATAG